MAQQMGMVLEEFGTISIIFLPESRINTEGIGV